MQIAKDKIFPSDLAYRPGETHDANQQTRTSSGTFLSREEDPKGALTWIEEKAARFTMLPVEHGEVRTLLYNGRRIHDWALTGLVGE